MSIVRREQFHLLLEDASGNHLGELHSVMDVSVVCQPTATIGRHIPAVVLGPEDPWGASIHADKTAYRLKPYAVVTEDGTTTEHPLGVFVFTTVTPHDRDTETVAGTGLASGTYYECQLHDQGYLPHGRSTLTKTYNVTTGSSINDAVTELGQMAGVFDTNLAVVGTVAGIHLAWPIGTPLIVPMRALVQRSGLVGPWFDVNGTMRATYTNHPGLAEPAAAFQPGTASPITADGVQRSSDNYAMPNTWLVRSRLDGGTFITGTYPTSPPDIGFVKVVDIPGLSTSSECVDRARDIALRETRVNETREFTARSVYTLELHDTVTYADQDWILDAWTIPLVPGSESTFRVRQQVEEE